MKLPFVTLGWDGYPTVMNEDGTVFSRDAEIFFNAKYYKDGDYKNNFPTCPITNEKLEIKCLTLNQKK